MAYMLFTFDNYYPLGGMNDHLATFSSIEDFLTHNVYVDYDNFQLFDTYNGNKSTLNMYRKIEELDDFLSTEEERNLRKKYLKEFVSNFVNGV